MIRAQIISQRDFLADAAAVQFTRNPRALATALKKCGPGYRRCALRHPRAREFDHLFFASTTGPTGLRPLAPHALLWSRIRAVEPDWDSTWPEEAPPDER